MPAAILSYDARADVGDTWTAWVLCTADDGTTHTPDSVAGTMTLPDGTSSALTATEQTTSGLYKIEFDLTQSGRHSAALTVTDATYGDEVVTFGIEVASVTQAARPDVSQVLTYLGTDNSYSSSDVADALAAETVAQAARCHIPLDYPDDLAQALKRRVARNLAARSVPVATYTSFNGGGTATRVPNLDAEIRRFEGPYLRLPVA